MVFSISVHFNVFEIRLQNDLKLLTITLSKIRTFVTLRIIADEIKKKIIVNVREPEIN